MPVQLTISSSSLRRFGGWLGRVVIVALLFVLLSATIRWATRPRDGFVTSIPSSHYVSVLMTSGTTYYGRLHAVRDEQFVRLGSVRTLSAPTYPGGKPSFTLGKQNDTYLDRSQIVSVVDIGTHPAAED